MIQSDILPFLFAVFIFDAYVLNILRVIIFKVFYQRLVLLSSRYVLDVFGKQESHFRNELKGFLVLACILQVRKKKYVDFYVNSTGNRNLLSY